jgi:diguanylate cyclase (GGDEF)-like protein
VLEAAREARSTGIGKTLDYRIRHKGGTWRVLESIASTIRNENGEVVKLVIVNRDVTERKRAEEQLEHNFFHDALTGLPNRRLFLDRLQHLFDHARRNPERQYAVLFVDLDGFKVFNDTMGPAVGDQVLVEIGRRLAICLRNDDTVSRPQDEIPIMMETVLSRMGGDEFTILLEEVADPSHAMRAAKRILSAVAEPFLVEGREVRTSASVGIALSTAAHERAEDLLQDADVAMRRAKAMGGSRCEVLDEAMHTRAVNRLKLEAELREAADSKLTATVVSHLKHLRVGVILDDFGTGNSSLSGLRQFPVDALKIDRSLVAGMLTDRGTYDTVELIILLAHKLKLKVIAEGIETSRQLDQLHTLGCDLGQGCLFSQPVEARAAEDLLRQASLIPRTRVAGAQ